MSFKWAAFFGLVLLFTIEAQQSSAIWSEFFLHILFFKSEANEVLSTVEYCVLFVNNNN